MSDDIRRVQSGAPWESLVGYCRATAVGKQVFVGGTAPVAEDGSCFAPGDPEAQARRCFEIALDALAELGGDASRVTRTRMYVTDISSWEAFGRAHAEVFGEHRPAATMVQVSALIDPQMLIEIELDAVLA
jgi:isochorismate pyruvate lyase